ncbi:MAG: CDP-alcohol phosphatidyltransferase family protein [Actinobacteria bacterium]|nr:CDP-alcohol phosphatidyltransferase family protein [Actinomycetota bacterium]
MFDVGKKDGPEVVSDRILTVPNVLSLLRILVLPYVYVLLLDERWMVAFWWLAGFAMSDWFDGYIARRFDQVSHFGKLFDPISDRLLFLVVGIAMILSGVVPWWVIVVLLARDVFVVAGGLVLMARKVPPPPVTRIGKAATFGLMFALPGFILAAGLGDGPGDPQPVWQAIAWVAWVVNTVLYYVAAGQYVLRSRRDLQAARAARETRAPDA